MIKKKIEIPQEKKKEWLHYKKGLTQRDLNKKLILKSKYELYHLLSKRMADLLYQTYKVKKVYLIGSLLKFEFFHSHSDIDLVVEGLRAEDYFSAVVELEKITNGEPFHLIDINDVSQEFKSKIINTGKLL